MLFEIASTIGIAKKNNEDFLFPQWEYEQHFNLHGCFANNLPNLPKVQEAHFHYQELPSIKNVDLVGYWQSYKYFEHCENFIRQIFEFQTSMPVQHGATSIHVRRGDYVKLSDYHTNLAITYYYEKAMEELKSDIYYVFSDDINFCREKFKGDKFYFIENGTNISDFMMMSRCENNIVANSSLSWWAAYLNKNPYKKVIAPSNWFGPSLSHSTKDLFPPSWIII